MLRVAQLLRKFPTIMEPKCSLQCSQNLTIYPHPGSVETSPHFHILLT